MYLVEYLQEQIYAGNFRVGKVFKVACSYCQGGFLQQ